MINYKKIKDAEAWELFCRAYLVVQGFVVEIPPNRGADGGRDLLVKEQLKGILATRPFRWLVSCKHYAKSKKSVGTSDENNILDRLTQHESDGFIGFYSTVASSALVNRLKMYRDQEKIKAFEIYDAARIETGFHDVGLSGVLLHHLPNSHTSLRPIHPLFNEYIPLECEICNRDLLKNSIRYIKFGIIIFAKKNNVIHSIHFVCKGQCDSEISLRLKDQGFLVNGWDDIDNYCNPLTFLRRLTGYMNEIRNNPSAFSDKAHRQMIDLYLSISQRTLRQTNAEDREDYRQARIVELY